MSLGESVGELVSESVGESVGESAGDWVRPRIRFVSLFPFGLPAQDDVCGIRRCAHEKFPVLMFDIVIPVR